jgi:hypothetical protein
MATLGPIAAPNFNVLFDPAKLDRDVQSFQRNQLLMQNAQKDQAAQEYERDANARLTMARQLVGLPEDQAAAQWGTERQRLQAAGLGMGLPEQFPGMERIRAVASSDLSTFQRMQIEERRRQTEGLMSLLGGGAPAMSGSGEGAAPAYPGSAGGSMSAAPVSMSAAAPAAVGGTGSIRADNADAARRREWAMANLSGPELEAELASISAGRASALTGQGPGTQYRANSGEGGVYAGLPAPAPGVPVLASGGQAGPRPASGGVAFGPRGLTQEQERILAVTAISNPAGAAAQMAQFRQQNVMTARQQAQDERQRQQDERRLRLDERRETRENARDAREAPGGPIRGNGLNNSLMNILITGDPASPEYAAAYGRLGAEEVNPATGAVRRPDMSMFRPPTYAPPGNAPAGSAPPVSPTATAAAGGMPSVQPPVAMNGLIPAGDQPVRPASLGPATALATAPTVNALAPQAVGGRSYGRADYQPSAQASPQAREAVRKAEVEVGRITSAIDRFEQVFSAQGGGSIGALLNNPTSPEAQQLLGAYEAMKATLRSEAFLNTGVLQPAEARMLDEMLLSPQSIRGLMATPDAMKARLAEMRHLVNRGLVQQRASAGLPPEVSMAGPGGQGSASPPQAGSRPPLSSFRR